MREKEKDILDDLFRSRLRNFEADTLPEDWDVIASRLPAEQVSLRSSRRKWPYWTAAAMIALIVVTGTFYISSIRETDPQIAGQIQQKTVETEQQLKEEFFSGTTTTEETVVADSQPLPSGHKESPRKPFRSVQTVTHLTGTTDIPIVTQTEDMFPVTEKDALQEMEETEVDQPVEEIREETGTESPVMRSQGADIPTATPKTKSTPSRKWGFGMGGGSLTAGSETTFSGLAFRNTSYDDEELLLLNAPVPSYEQRTHIRHKTPVSFGVAVSRYITNRLAIQSGLTYSMLTSDWETNLDYHKKTRQRLHLIGIPLSITYSIAEWNRFQLYATAGAMTEVNVSGKLRERMYVDDELIRTEMESTRMKPWLWSVNGRAGISYPLLKYVSAFGEVGAAYYFDNGSEIETIHSEKPFNVSLNFGLRVGF